MNIKEIKKELRNSYGITSGMNVNEAYRYNEGTINGLFWGLGENIDDEMKELIDFNEKLYKEITGEEY